MECLGSVLKSTFLSYLCDPLTVRYTNDDLSIQRHLTNTSIQTKLFRNESADFTQFTNDINSAVGPGDFGKRRTRSLMKYLRNQGIDHAAVWNKYKLCRTDFSYRHRIRNVIRLTLLPLAIEENASRGTEGNHHFELLGFGMSQFSVD